MSTHTEGPMQAKFVHAALLNALVEMQESPEYAVRKQVLIEAELAIAAADVAADSARDLLAALQAMYAAQYKPFDHADRRAAKEQASAAISKATGAKS